MIYRTPKSVEDKEEKEDKVGFDSNVLNLIKIIVKNPKPANLMAKEKNIMVDGTFVLLVALAAGGLWIWCRIADKVSPQISPEATPEEIRQWEKEHPPPDCSNLDAALPSRWAS